MRPRGIFVTGTNTDVGKTVVTRALARLLRRRGFRVAAIKPVESGVVDGRPSDAARLAEAAGFGGNLNEISAYRFQTPVSPHLAAQLEGAAIDRELLAGFLNGWRHKADLILAEGAGGLLVPINDRETYADVVAMTDYAILIVAPNVLGTINATLLTIEAARSRGIPVLGVILNRTPAGDLGNADAIAGLGHIPVLGEVPDLPDEDDRMADILSACVDISPLIS